MVVADEFGDQTVDGESPHGQVPQTFVRLAEKMLGLDAPVLGALRDEPLGLVEFVGARHAAWSRGSGRPFDDLRAYVPPVLDPNSSPSTEVYLLENETLDEHALQRLQRALRGVGAPSSGPNGLRLAAGELVDNIRDHSASPQSVFAYRVRRGMVEIVVADIGMGALASLRGVARNSDITTDTAAVMGCVMNGRTARPESEAGVGLSNVRRRIVDEGGQLAFRSGTAEISLEPGEVARRVRTRSAPKLHGFFAAGFIHWSGA